MLHRRKQKKTICIHIEHFLRRDLKFAFIKHHSLLKTNLACCSYLQHRLSLLLDLRSGSKYMEVLEADFEMKFTVPVQSCITWHSVKTHWTFPLIFNDLTMYKSFNEHCLPLSSFIFQLVSFANGFTPGAVTCTYFIL